MEMEIEFLLGYSCFGTFSVLVHHPIQPIISQTETSVSFAKLVRGLKAEIPCTLVSETVLRPPQGMW